MDKPTQAIAHYAETLAYDDLTPDAVHTSKRMLIDAAACALAAYPTAPAIAARAIAGAALASPPAHVLISGEPTTPDLAAYAGALMVRYWDLNDTYLHGGHPSDIIPGILAVAELTGANGKDTLVALTIAYEVFAALSDAPGMLATSAGGRVAMASAAAASRLLALDESAIAQAVSLAAANTISRGVRGHGPLSMWRAALSANAARGGIFAAQQAAQGIQGPEQPFAALGAGTDAIGGTIGGRAANTHLKAFAAEYHAQAAIHAALDLRRRIDPIAIAQISVHTYAHALAGIGSTDAVWSATDIDTMLHSMPYLVSVALLDGDVSPSQFAPSRLAATDVRALMARTSVVEDPAITAAYVATVKTRVEITTSDGRTHAATCEQPLGHTLNPLSDTDLNAKLRRYGDDLLTPGQQASFLSQAWGLDGVGDVEGLLRALRAG